MALPTVLGFAYLVRLCCACLVQLRMLERRSAALHEDIVERRDWNLDDFFRAGSGCHCVAVEGRMRTRNMKRSAAVQHFSGTSKQQRKLWHYASPAVSRRALAAAPPGCRASRAAQDVRTVTPLLGRWHPLRRRIPACR